MDEVIARVREHADVTTEQAQKAVEAVLEILQDRLPHPLDEQIEHVLADPERVDDIANMVSKGIGGFLGGKQ